MREEARETWIGGGFAFVGDDPHDRCSRFFLRMGCSQGLFIRRATRPWLNEHGGGSKNSVMD